MIDKNSNDKIWIASSVLLHKENFITESNKPLNSQYQGKQESYENYRLFHGPRIFDVFTNPGHFLAGCNRYDKCGNHAFLQ